MDKERSKILLAALPHVSFDGWSRSVLDAGVREAGFEPEMASRAFPGGVADLVEFFSLYTDRQMAEILMTKNLAEMHVRDRIAEAVRARLGLLAGHREAVRWVIAFLAFPRHTSLGLKCLYRTVDEMWHAAGDTSTDFNFYTKRLLLAGVYSATLFYWLDDDSKDSEATWGFLDRRIADVMKISEAEDRLRNLVAGLPDPLAFFHRVSTR